jgi:hypothetical protein
MAVNDTQNPLKGEQYSLMGHPLSPTIPFPEKQLI